MCHMIYCPPGKTPPVGYLKQVCAIHKDGYGHAILTDAGSLIVTHGFSADSVITNFLRWREEYPDTPALFHARHATAKNVRLDNIQPLTTYNGHIAVAHNGFMFPVPDDDLSDTAVFTRDMLSKWDLDDRGDFATLEKDLGPNKLIILADAQSTMQESVYLLNEQLGFWADDGCWHSSLDYQGGQGRRQDAIDARVCGICLEPTNFEPGDIVPGALICSSCAAAAMNRYDLLSRR